MKGKKGITAVLCICIALALAISVAAAVRYVFTSTEGETSTQTVNRVNITVKNTDFTFTEVQEDGMLLCRSRVSIEKTEADFYGVLDSITMSGQSFGYVLYAAGKNNGDDGSLPEKLLLPEAEKETPLEWEITFTVPYTQGQNQYTAAIDLVYTTGTKPNLTQQYKTSIPITITVK